MTRPCVLTSKETNWEPRRMFSQAFAIVPYTKDTARYKALHSATRWWLKKLNFSTRCDSTHPLFLYSFLWEVLARIQSTFRTLRKKNQGLYCVERKLSSHSDWKLKPCSACKVVHPHISGIRDMPLIHQTPLTSVAMNILFIYFFAWRVHVEALWVSWVGTNSSELQQ